MRKIISLISAFLLMFSTLQFNHVKAAADVTAPTIDSISVDKTTATVGDSVKISLKASDDVGIKRVIFAYKAPITGKSIYINMNYNPSSQVYEGYFTVTNNAESGIYRASEIWVYDTSDNYTYLASYNDSLNKLGNGQFTVSGTTGADVTSPTIDSISVDKTAATVGDSVKVSLKASDDVGIKRIIFAYKAPVTGKSIYINMNYNPSSKLYEGQFTVNNNSESGIYKASEIWVYDTSDNYTYLASYNDSLNKLGNGQFTVSGTTGADVTSPTIDSISVDKSRATYGDSVKVSLKASDDVGIKRVIFTYKAPITGKSIYINMNYNPSSKLYEGQFTVNNNSESGIYKASEIWVYDTSDNYTYLASYNDSLNKLSSGQFFVYTESNPPTFSSLSIDKGTVESGDAVHFTMEAADDTNLQSATITYVSPVTHSKKTVPLSYDGQHFIGQMSIDQNTEVGKWAVDSIEIKDTNGNSTVVKADAADLSAGTFTVLPPIAPINSYIVNSNETWSNKTINTDVYIAPGAVLTINGNVSITGNVYVLGGLRTYGGLSLNGTLYANSVYFGYYYPVNGQAIISGSNRIFSITASNRILTNVPFTLNDTPIVGNNGKVTLTGATLPFVTVEINGQNIPLKSNGTFRVTDFNIGNSKTLNVKITDLSGFSYYYSYQVADLYIDDFTKDSTSITGKTIPNSTIKITDNGGQVGSGNSNEQGNFSIPVSGLIENHTVRIDVYNAENVLVTSQDKTVKDITAPDKPTVHDVSDQDSTVTGQAEAGSKIEVKVNGNVIGSGTTGADGNFSVNIPVQKAGVELAVTATDNAGNVSDGSTVVVKDVTPPENPMVNDVTEKDSSVSGQAEPGAKVEVKVNDTAIGSGTVNSDGTFSVGIPVQKAGVELAITATDKAGNVSKTTTVVVKDATSPTKPLVNEVTDKDSSVTGQAEAGSKVEVKVNSKVIGSGTTDKDGKFSITIPTQKAGTELIITATDETGNRSEETKVISKATLRGWVQDKGLWYYYDPATGIKKTGWVMDKGTRYFFNKDGVMQTGWVKDGNNRYYLKSSGAMQTGWVKVGTSWYYLNNTGVMQTGWVKVGTSWYYLNNSGAMQTGWVKSGSSWYYLNNSGAMQTGWVKVGTSWYYLNNSGAMQTGWLKSGSSWYYLNTSGAMQTGWATISKKRYYFYPNGILK